MFMLAVPFLLAVNSDWIAALGGRTETNGSGDVTAVRLRGAFVADSDLDRLAAFEQLETLDLSHTRVTDLGLLRLKDLRNVRELNLFYAELVTDEGLAAVKTWPRIERLNFRGTKVTDNTLALLAGKESIRALDLGFAEVTDSGLQHLVKLKGLRELAIGGNKMTEVGLEVLRALPNLTHLDISGKQRTDSGLWFVGVSDLGLDAVASLAKLESLNLSGTQVSATGVEKLQALQLLKRLDLHGAKRIGDSVVPVLAAMPALGWVDLFETAVTPAARQTLRASRPGLTVLP
jgi:internalin A